MFKAWMKGKRTIAIGRLTAVVTAASFCLMAAAFPVSAQSLGDGKIYGTAECSLATHTAVVGVSVLEPSVYASSGLYFYTEIYAKATSAAKYVRIKSGYSGLIKTWSTESDFLSGNSLTNRPRDIFSASFTGRGYYDMHVMYWFAKPGATAFTYGGSFNIPGDRDSFIYLSSTDANGSYYGGFATVCYL